MPFLILVAAPAIPLAVLFGWARWLRRRTAAPRFAAWAAYALIVAGALEIVVSALAVYGAVREHASHAQAVEPSENARALAEGISTAMNCGAMGLLAMIATSLWLLFATWRWHWSVRPPKIEGDPPYR